MYVFMSICIYMPDLECLYVTPRVFICLYYLFICSYIFVYIYPVYIFMTHCK